jgi:hypothetical protein
MELKEIELKNGFVLVSVTGYGGETDFYAMYDIIGELLHPEHATYGVDSMCVDGSFRKDGILVRMSSECVTDCCCFHYDRANMAPEDVEKVKSWIAQVTEELHKRFPR